MGAIWSDLVLLIVVSQEVDNFPVGFSKFETVFGGHKCGKPLRPVFEINDIPVLINFDFLAFKFHGRHFNTSFISFLKRWNPHLFVADSPLSKGQTIEY
jgi:hypothetical protein